MSDLTAKVRAALAAATPGPWEQSRALPVIVYGADRNDIYLRPREEIERNVRLIASAPSWLAALCDRLDAEPAPVKPSREDVTAALCSPHGPVPGERLWQRNYKTGMLDTTCVCGEVLSIKEEYTLAGAGLAWAEHTVKSKTDAVLALLPGRSAPTEDELVTLMDEWVDDLAPLNRAAFRGAAAAILSRLRGESNG